MSASLLPLLPDLLAVVLEYLSGDEYVYVEVRASGCFGHTDSDWYNVVRRVSTEVHVRDSKNLALFRGVRNVNLSGTHVVDHEHLLISVMLIRST